jgi:hypothetical protein
LEGEKSRLWALELRSSDISLGDWDDGCFVYLRVVGSQGKKPGQLEKGGESWHVHMLCCNVSGWIMYRWFCTAQEFTLGRAGGQWNFVRPLSLLNGQP